MAFKIGDRVKVIGSYDSLSSYAAERAYNKVGEVIKVDFETLHPFRMQQLDVTTPDVICYKLTLENGDWCWVYDFHLQSDGEDSLPYDEWVAKRDWNKIFREKTDSALRGVLGRKDA